MTHVNTQKNREGVIEQRPGRAVEDRERGEGVFMYSVNEFECFTFQYSSNTIMYP